MTQQQSAFSLSYGDNGVAWLKIDVPDEKMNTLQSAFVEQVSEVLAELKNKQDVKGLVVHSGKPDNFIAGADIRMLAACTTAEEEKYAANTSAVLPPSFVWISVSAPALRRT